MVMGRTELGTVRGVADMRAVSSGNSRAVVMRTGEVKKTILREEMMARGSRRRKVVMPTSRTSTVLETAMARRGTSTRENSRTMKAETSLVVTEVEGVVGRGTSSIARILADREDRMIEHGEAVEEAEVEQEIERLLGTRVWMTMDRGVLMEQGI